MNRYAFRKNVGFVVLFYLLATCFGVMLKHGKIEYDLISYDEYKDFIPIIIFIPAAWLGFCFESRHVYLKDTRELFSKIVVAVQDAIQYTHLSNPVQSDYATVMRTLSITIDEVRGTFSNYGKSKNNVGLYPFQRLKDIHAIVSNLGFGQNFDKIAAVEARKVIVEIWSDLRLQYLNELQLGVSRSNASDYDRDAREIEIDLRKRGYR